MQSSLASPHETRPSCPDLIRASINLRDNFFRRRRITGSSPVTTISIDLKIIARSDSSAAAQRAKVEATLRELAAAFDDEPKHPAYFGLGFLHPRFQRRKIRCVAGPRHHPQEILARCFRSESLGDADTQGV